MSGNPFRTIKQEYGLGRGGGSGDQRGHERMFDHQGQMINVDKCIDRLLALDAIIKPLETEARV